MYSGVQTKAACLSLVQKSNLSSLMFNAFYEDGLGLALEEIYHPHPCQMMNKCICVTGTEFIIY